MVKVFANQFTAFQTCVFGELFINQQDIQIFIQDHDAVGGLFKYASE